MRRLIAFPCAGETLIGTLDLPDGATAGAVLIVSGGNELRAGAHRGMAMLARDLAGRGLAVLRFDRRGIGDSSGTNEGHAGSAADIAAAAAALHAAAPDARPIGFGNCDGASALARFGRAAGLARVVLANPWLAAPIAADLPAAAAIRGHYRARLRDPAAWRRLLSGGVRIDRLARGLTRAGMREEVPAEATATLAAIATWGVDARVILAAGDGTALAFADAAARHGLMVPITTVATGSHSFADAREALVAAIVGAAA
jgi:exosortase A-associated hydrolase 1